MNVKYINPFLDAVVNVMTTMAQVKLTPGKPSIKSTTEVDGDVSGVIELTGDTEGSMGISLSFKLIKTVMMNMLGDEIEEINDEVKDAVGEFTNMIAGDARRNLSLHNLNLTAGIPKVNSGQGHTINHTVDGPVLAVPFESGNGNLVIEFTVKD